MDIPSEEGAPPSSPQGLAVTPTSPGTRKRAPAASTFKLLGVQIENLRAYKDALLYIGSFTVLVGNNNEGKSSALRILDWALNIASMETLSGAKPLTDTEQALLLPANQTAGRARRVTLLLEFDDMRRGKAFGQDRHHPAQLRVTVNMTTRSVRLNVGRPRKNEKHDPRAAVLLQLVRNRVQFVLVPSTRDARSARFRSALEARLRTLLLDRFGHSKQAGAPAEYRRAKAVLDVLGEMVGKVQDELVQELQSNLPQGLFRDAHLALRAEPDDLAEWVRQCIDLSISTGEHDAEFVRPDEVGNGLQSLLDVGLTLASLKPTSDACQVIAAVEEPEAFLHPAGQRRVAITFRNLADQGRCQVLLTTHSPYFVDEARYGDVVLARSHKFFAPVQTGDSTRAEINTALMTTRSAEVFFARGVLLVEGPGDVALFDVLLRRIMAKTAEPALAQLAVLEVGGKKHFAPWWRLLKSYGAEGNRPISWVSLMDADAAAKEGNERALLRSSADAEIDLGREAIDAVVEFGDLPYDAYDLRKEKAKAINALLAPYSVFLFSIDCEWASFGAAAETCPSQVAEVLDCAEPVSDQRLMLARRAGSKARTGRASDDARKQPYLRRRLAEVLSLAELPPEIVAVLESWFSTVMARENARLLLENLKAPSLKAVVRRGRLRVAGV